MFLLGTVTLVGCGQSTTEPTMVSSVSDVPTFIVDIEAGENQKSVEQYLIEAEIAKEKLRDLLEQQSQVEEDNTASLINWIIPTVSAIVAEDSVTVEAQIEILLEEIQTAIESAESVAQSAEELETVQVTAETITEEVEAAAEEVGIESVAEEIQEKTSSWKERSKNFEEKLMKRFELSAEKKEVFKARREEHKTAIEAMRTTRKTDRAAMKAQIESGEVTKEEAFELMKIKRVEATNLNKENFQKKINWMKENRPDMAKKLEIIQAARIEKKAAMKESKAAMKAAVEAGDLTKEAARTDVKDMIENAKEVDLEMRKEMKEGKEKNILYISNLLIIRRCFL